MLFGSLYLVFELNAGEDFSTIITTSFNGAPLDITNVSNMKFTVRRSFFYDKDVHEFNVEKIEPYTSGSFLIKYPAALTKTMKSGRQVFDFFVDYYNTETNTTIRLKIAEGIVIVVPTADVGNVPYPF